MVLRITDCKDTCSDTDAVGLIGVNDYMVDVQAPFGGGEGLIGLGEELGSATGRPTSSPKLSRNADAVMTFSMPSAPQKRFCANGRSFDTHSTERPLAAARSLKVRTLVAHTGDPPRERCLAQGIAELLAADRAEIGAGQGEAGSRGSDGG